MSAVARPLVFVGDLFRAVRVLRADEEAMTCIAELLGLDRSVATSEVATSQGRVPTGRASAAVGPRREPRRPAEKPDSTEGQDSHGGPSVIIPSTLELTIRRHEELGLKALPLPPSVEGDDSARPRYVPLLEPGWTRAIISSALSTASDDGALNIDEIVDTIANLRPLLQLPRQPLPTMRRGVQILLDRSPALAPFARDQDWLTDEVLRIGGTDRVRVLDFHACPTRPHTDDLGMDEPTYSPPAPGTAVLVVTDLGIGRPRGWNDWADEAEWLNFAAILRKAGCPLVAMVPYPPARWPLAIARDIAILQFDRPTTASVVRRVVGVAHSVST
jgi:hypothetical protein